METYNLTSAYHLSLNSYVTSVTGAVKIRTRSMLGKYYPFSRCMVSSVSFGIYTYRSGVTIVPLVRGYRRIKFSSDNIRSSVFSN